jgi:hypothetical protein
MSARQERELLSGHCDVIQAIRAFNYALRVDEKRKLDQLRSWAASASASQLRDANARLDGEVSETASQFGCKMPPFAFAAEFLYNCGVFDDDPRLPRDNRKGAIPHVSKAEIETRYFSNFANGNAVWKRFSPHLLLQVHYEWTVPSDGRIQFFYTLPEALLYEDMAFAYNSALEMQDTVQKIVGPHPNLDAKRFHFYLRTAVLNAYYFVEAYLNGMAFDFCYTNADKISEEDKDFLLERSSEKKRGFVSFERKATQYLKLILGTQHPPLQDSNCKSLKFLLTDGKELRDSIVHQSPKIHGTSPVAEKIKWMLGINMDKVTETVDAAVEFIQELEKKLGSHGVPVNWLYSRADKGLFPPKSFE